MSIKTSNANETERDGSANERLSLLDILNNKNQSTTRVILLIQLILKLKLMNFKILKKTILHRIILVGKLRNLPNKAKLGGTENI